MIQAVYGLWVARNDARDGKKMASPHEIMESIYSHLIEWRQVHDAAARVPQARTVQRWKPPSQGWVKVNSDGAVAGNGEKGGAGVVIRDAGGAFLAGARQFFNRSVDPEAVEILACKSGLLLAIERGFQSVHLELDSLPVVQMLNDRHKCMAAVGSCIEEIKERLHTRAEYRVTWVRRTANVAAHKLAKVGVGDELCKVWLGSPPDFVLSVISDDIPSYAG